MDDMAFRTAAELADAIAARKYRAANSSTTTSRQTEPVRGFGIDRLGTALTGKTPASYGHRTTSPRHIFA